MASPLLPSDPQQLGPYYLDGRLGAGGQGVVYEGYDAEGGRVAVKVLRDVLDGDRDMLRKEIRAWRLVAPFCTTRVLHDDLDGPVPFVVSEYVAGPDLRRAVDSGGSYDPEDLRRLAIGVATALVAIHRAGVVHRDLKPENILLAPGGPRVIDFGIARIVEGTATAGVPMGTLRYMPPERYRGEHGDGKVDVWGWAAVVLFAATGEHAFAAGNAGALAYQIATYEPDVSALEEPLRSLVTAALAKDPAARPTSEELLLSLVGRADLAEAVRGIAPGREPVSGAPSRADIAESVFTGLDTRAQETVSSVLLRLVAPGERAEDTLRSARKTEFADGRTPTAVHERMLGAFTQAGILVWEDETVSLCSAALIRAWPRLREWVEDERTGLSVHQRLCEASRVWDDHGRKNSDLIQGTALDRTRDWAATGRRHLTLNRSEQQYLDAAGALARRRSRLRVVASAVLAFLLVVAAGAALVAFDQRQTVISQRDRAASAQIAGKAQSVGRTNPELGRRLAVASARLADTPEAWSALFALRHQTEDDTFQPSGSGVTESDLDGSGRILVTATDRRVEFWNVETREKAGSYTAPARVHRVDVSDDGTTASVSTEDGFTRLLDTAGARPRAGHTYRTVRDDNGAWPFTDISPRGTYLLVETGDPSTESTLVVWDTRTATTALTRTTTEPLSALASSSFSPDEQVLSLPGDKGRPFTWIDLRTHEKLPLPKSFTRLKADDIEGPVSFGPNGERVAVTTKGGLITVLGRRTGQTEIELKGTDLSVAYPLRFSHDGRYLVQNAAVWDTTRTSPQGDPITHYPLTAGECFHTTSLRFTADDTKLRCVGTDGVARSFDVRAFTKPPTRTSERYTESAVSADRRTLALLGNGRIDIWSLDTRTLRFPTATAETTVPPIAGNIVLSPDGGRLAVQNATQIDIWDVSGEGGTNTKLLGSLTVLRNEQLNGAYVNYAFSPDNTSLAVQVATRDGINALSYWDLASMRRVREIRADLGYPSAAAVIFHPDGRSVIAAPNFGRVAFPSGTTMAKGSPGTVVDSISGDGTTLYTHPRTIRPSLRFWDTTTLQPAGSDLRTGPITDVLYAPEDATTASADGRLLATVHQSGTSQQINVWDSRTASQLGVPLTGPVDPVVALSFSPDGSTLTAVDENGRFFTRTTAPDQLLKGLCARSGSLTEEEWVTHIPDVPYRKTC